MARILVTGNVELGGFDRCSTRVANTLQGLNEHHVDVMVLRAADQSHQAAQGRQRILRVSTDADGPTTQHIHLLARALGRQWQSEDYDIVHCLDLNTAAQVANLKRQHESDCKLVIDLGGSAMVAPLADPQQTAGLWAAADHVIVSAEAQRAWAPEEIAVSVVPLGVDINAFDWALPSKPAAPVVTLVTAATQSRGIEQVLHAIALLAQQQVTAQLAVVAPLVSPLLQHLQNVARFLQVASQVQWLGGVTHDQLPTVLANATICIALANDQVDLTAATPTKVLEYWACRRPVLALAPLHETMTDGHAAMSTSATPQHIASAIKTLLASPELQQRLAEVGYDLVRRYHTAAAARRAMQQVYRSL